MSGEILKSINLVKHFSVKGDLPLQSKTVHALDGISFSVGSNDCLGVVGESGSGKTTLARCIMRLIEPTEGDVKLDGKSIFTKAGEKELRRNVQIVFQDPQGSLNPRFSIGRVLREPLTHLSDIPKCDHEKKVSALLEQVGLHPSDAEKLPHQFSGGQQQRIAIARALAPEPRVVVLDEPTSALDVSLQAQVINLLVRLGEEFDVAYILITHDLSVVRQLCDELLVIYLGRAVEKGSTPKILSSPNHPYSKALMESVLLPDPSTRDEEAPVRGEIPSPIDPPSGCRFHTRCSEKMDICDRDDPKAAVVDGVKNRF